MVRRFGDFNMEKHTKRGKNKQPFEIFQAAGASRKTRRNHPGGQNEVLDQGIRYDPMVSTNTVAKMAPIGDAILENCYKLASKPAREQ